MVFRRLIERASRRRAADARPAFLSLSLARRDSHPRVREREQRLRATHGSPMGDEGDGEDDDDDDDGSAEIDLERSSSDRCWNLAGSGKRTLCGLTVTAASSVIFGVSRRRQIALKLHAIPSRHLLRTKVVIVGGK